MNIPVLQNNLLQAENNHLREAYKDLAYESNQPFEQFVKQFEEYKDKLKEDSTDDDKKKRRFFNRIFMESEDVNATAFQLADDKSIMYNASKIAM